MNTDTLTGTATELGGRVKEGLGAALGDTKLEGEGKADRLGGTAQKTVGQAKSAIGRALDGDIDGLIDAVRGFARERPFLAAALGGVIALAVVNTLRGRVRG